jgi:hypothetical protein
MNDLPERISTLRVPSIEVYDFRPFLARSQTYFICTSVLQEISFLCLVDYLAWPNQFTCSSSEWYFSCLLSSVSYG